MVHRPLVGFRNRVTALAIAALTFASLWLHPARVFSQFDLNTIYESLQRRPASSMNDTISADIDCAKDAIEQLGPFRIHREWHPRDRRERFPSAEDRVKLYMSNWYSPPCNNTTKLSRHAKIRYRGKDRLNDSWPRIKMSNPWDPASDKKMVYDSIISPHTLRPYVLDRRIVQDCMRSEKQYKEKGELPSEKRVEYRKNMRPYCVEAIKLLDIMEDLDSGASNNSTPVLAYFGDGPGISKNDLFDVPFFSKYRGAATSVNLQIAVGAQTSACKPPSPLTTLKYRYDIIPNRYSPIVWRIKYERHWKPLKEALESDTPWEQKKNMAIWRGGMTGKTYEPQITGPNLERCRSNQRCSFVLDHIDSTLIDCGLSESVGRLNGEAVNGSLVVKDALTMKQLQEYKVIISFEGNDVSSGLKWSLQSESVVLMPPPTRTSWAMEELLQPWVHYVPMLPDGSDAEEKVQWVLDNDTEARRIAERATLFIYDFVYHPDAESDHQRINQAIARRYRDLWQ